jgi:hypothetical protein
MAGASERHGWSGVDDAPTGSTCLGNIDKISNHMKTCSRGLRDERETRRAKLTITVPSNQRI